MYRSMAAYRQHRRERSELFRGVEAKVGRCAHRSGNDTSIFALSAKEERRRRARERVGLMARVLKQRIRRIASQFREKITFTAGT